MANALLLDVGVPVPTPPEDKRRLFVDADGILKLMSPGGGEVSVGMPASVYLAAAYGISPDTADNGPPLTALLERIRATNRGARILYEPAPYDFQTEVPDANDGTYTKAIEHMGAGRGSTYFNAAGALLAGGNMFTLNKSRQQHFFNLSVGAASKRAAGNAFNIIGDSDAVDGTPPPVIENHVFQDVDMHNQFNGYYFEDGVGDLGVMGVHVERGEFKDFAAGGCPVWMNSQHGALNYFRFLLHRETVGVAANLRPLATMRLTKYFDIRCLGVESVYARNGLIIDPGDGAIANTGWFNECIWGGVTDRCVSIIPHANATMVFNQFTGMYLDQGTGMIIEGAKAKGIQIDRLSTHGCTDGLKLSACSSVIVRGYLVGGHCTRGFYATGSATDWSVDMVFGNTSGQNTTGWAVDVGCDRFSVHAVGAAQYSTTPKTDNSGAVTKNLVEVG